MYRLTLVTAGSCAIYTHVFRLVRIHSTPTVVPINNTQKGWDIFYVFKSFTIIKECFVDVGGMGCKRSCVTVGPYRTSKLWGFSNYQTLWETVAKLYL